MKFSSMQIPHCILRSWLEASIRADCCDIDLCPSGETQGRVWLPCPRPEGPCKPHSEHGPPPLRPASARVTHSEASIPLGVCKANTDPARLLPDLGPTTSRPPPRSHPGPAAPHTRRCCPGRASRPEPPPQDPQARVVSPGPLSHVIISAGLPRSLSGSCPSHPRGSSCCALLSVAVTPRPHIPAVLRLSVSQLMREFREQGPGLLSFPLPKGELSTGRHPARLAGRTHTRRAGSVMLSRSSSQC